MMMMMVMMMMMMNWMKMENVSLHSWHVQDDRIIKNKICNSTADGHQRKGLSGYTISLELIVFPTTMQTSDLYLFQLGFTNFYLTLAVNIMGFLQTL
jgi:hypothetical protein